MSEWLKKIAEEVDKKYTELPEWKKTPECELSNRLQGEGRSGSNIREPKTQE